MVPAEKERFQEKMAELWDRVIGLYAAIPTTSNIIETDADRQIIIWLMEEGDIIVDDTNHVISRESLVALARAANIDDRELLKHFINHHKVILARRNGA